MAFSLSWDKTEYITGALVNTHIAQALYSHALLSLGRAKLQHRPNPHDDQESFLMKRGIAAVLLCALALSAAITRAEQVLVLQAAGMVDVLTGEIIAPAEVVIEGARVARISRGHSDHDSAQVIALGDRWLLPGLMNMHTHLGLALPGAMAAQAASENQAQLVLRMADIAREALLSGVTTIRQPGDRLHADLALRDAINRGTVPGPRIISAGERIMITGGHGSGIELLNDGPYELRKAARYQIRAGAQWIKIAISGGIATQGGGLDQPLMTRDEIAAVVDIANRHGIKVVAHSGSTEATRVAIEEGVHSIEHGYYLDREVLREMTERGTWYVPTIVVAQPPTLPFYERIGSPPWYMERVRSVGEAHWQALRTAIEEGVKIALGSDGHPHEANDGTTATIRELEYYVEAGMTPLQALQSATIQPARMLDLDAELGTIAPGMLADIVAVGGNPLDDIRRVRTLSFVMKNGIVYRNDP
jgi:imidazolonepropionase-like amidohydrolase